ncbi:MAG: phosphoribosylglycinamide formyltransferase [Treponema sp.]|nr:phosphoribosylglycinamide formyltransferase [Treponema sp.]
MNIAVLVSGGGTNLQALIDFEKQNEDCPYKIVVVMSDHKDAYAIERAKNANIPVELVSPYAVMGVEVAKAASREEKRNAVSDKVLEYCKKYNVDAVVNAGWLTVLSSKIITEYEGRMINLHPALLPKFGGVGMWGHHVHEAVIAAKETESGCTVHFVDGGCDTGKIIVQKKVPVLEGDTPDSLYARIAPEEHKAIVEGTCILAEMLNK